MQSVMLLRSSSRGLQRLSHTVERKESLRASSVSADHFLTVQSLVGEKLFDRYDRLLLQKTLDSMSDVTYCPRIYCGSAVILEKSSKAALCSECGFAFCVICRKTYHGMGKCETKKKYAERYIIDLPQSQVGVKALWEDYVSGSRERKRLLENRYGSNLLVSIMEKKPNRQLDCQQ
ncbi:E3 ubiquitin-protein ligase RNF14-like [Neolamprologus brichardi]|uniref:E3 ubiquitin-protein ligase RNF14-like n=1 Tax=Neolamprologus brichardi TaxID=32507 RepID=UPI0016439B82|nr:E3 ubiquitin-protein ligase RNF14-like [Neolamprologus brichardi]